MGLENEAKVYSHSLNMVCFNRTELWACSLSLCRSHGESPSVRKSFNFVQMTLEDEEEEERRPVWAWSVYYT